MSTIELPASTELKEWQDWLVTTAITYHLEFDQAPLILLAHTSEGVIWGKVDTDGLNLSGDAFGKWKDPIKSRITHLDVILESRTLQQLRLFNHSGELLVWRDREQFKCAVKGSDDQHAETIDSQYFLWGTELLAEFAGFKLLQEGERGLWHIPPTLETSGEKAQLNIRHYIAYDDMGQAYLSGTRLLGLEWR